MAELRAKQKERRNTMALSLLTIEERVVENRERKKSFTDPMEEMKAKQKLREGRRMTETTSIDDKVKELQGSGSQRHYSDPMAELKAKQKERRNTMMGQGTATRTASFLPHLTPLHLTPPHSTPLHSTPPHSTTASVHHPTTIHHSSPLPLTLRPRVD
jgi:hypothetical protein